MLVVGFAQAGRSAHRAGLGLATAAAPVTGVGTTVEIQLPRDGQDSDQQRQAMEQSAFSANA